MTNHRIIEHLDKLIEISIALSEEKTQEELLEMILRGAKSITNADGGTLYLIEDNQAKMNILHSNSLNIHLGGTSNSPINLPSIPLYLDNGSPNYSNVVSYTYHHNKAVNIPDVYHNTLFDFSGAKKFDKLNKYQSKSFLAIPLKNHENDTIGILQLINAISPELQNIIEFDSISMRFTEALASQAAMVLTKQRLISELEKMFDSLIELIASAIDDKSPYTGGHCRRVPELTSLIAEAAHNSQSDYLKNFQLSNSDRYQLKVAGWLHDCGKLTTPEYVVDKATKLETIYDRIETVETRFEVLQRDIEIKHLKEQINALQQGEIVDSINHSQAQEKLTADLNFIKKSNTGSEFMPPGAQERIKEIAQRTWVKAGKELPFLSTDEVLNLNISRGTLTNQERDIIQKHISTTIAMLNKINFPKHLQNVPEYAGAHHERMDGKGYPNKLTREQMSIPARAMAIADVFEALTAADRPYKEPKKLSEALLILEKMKEDNHIDPDIFDAFIQEKVYLKYSHQFLDDSQIDIS